MDQNSLTIDPDMKVVKNFQKDWRFHYLPFAIWPQYPKTGSQPSLSIMMKDLMDNVQMTRKNANDAARVKIATMLANMATYIKIMTQYRIGDMV